VDDLTVAIHQPNLYPWLGYFNKIARADVFVFLDDVQIQKTGASYTNRVSIALDGRAHPITAPIRRESGLWTIAATRFSDEDWRTRTIKTLQGAYAKAPCFRQSRDFVFGLIGDAADSIGEYNVRFIRSMAHALGLRARLVRSSELESIEEEPTRRLADLVRAVDGNRYLSGNGAAAYQNREVFASHGIELEYIDNSRLVYAQPRTSAFIPGLSIIDALFAIGVEATGALLREPASRASG
jgi:hypothetical protein